MANSGLLQKLSERGELHILAPSFLQEPLKRMGFVFHKHPGDPEHDQGLSVLRRKLIAFVDSVFYFCFPNRDKCPNATADLHRKYYLQQRKTRQSRLVAHLMLFCARALSSAMVLRSLLQKIYARLLPQERLHTIIDGIKPDLMIACTFGMGAKDAEFLVAAKQKNVKSAVLVQSWDRTSNKGYPPVHCDAALVWNKIMQFECEALLDFDPRRVFVDGAPSWDAHFQKNQHPDTQKWRANLGIDPAAKIIYYAGGSFGNHAANMDIIPLVLNLARTQPFHIPIHIIFRPAPQYMTNEQDSSAQDKILSLRTTLEKLAPAPALTIAYPVGSYWGENFLPAREDLDAMLTAIQNCDISISHVSSQMIESCIFDKPTINIEYGERCTKQYSVKLSDYRPEHLLRVYRTNAIMRASTLTEIIDYIRFALENPDRQQRERGALVDQEIPVNRGCAASAVSERLVSLTQCPPT